MTAAVWGERAARAVRPRWRDAGLAAMGRCDGCVSFEAGEEGWFY